MAENNCYAGAQAARVAAAKAFVRANAAKDPHYAPAVWQVRLRSINRLARVQKIWGGWIYGAR